MKTQLARFTLMSSLIAGVVLLANAASAQCELFPIALPAATLDQVEPGTEITNIVDGVNPEDFGWLSWTGSQTESDFLASITGTGDSYTYEDPVNIGNTVISSGNWVVAKTDVTDTRAVRQ